MRATRPRAVRGAAIGLALALVSSPYALRAQRSVEGNTIHSPELPDAALRVDPSLEHIGAERFVLYGVADVELHVFVEAEGDRVQRLLWVQFEGFRDDNDRTYDYTSDPTVEIEGRPFHVNARFYPPSGFAGRPGSDGDRAARLLRERGLELGPALGRVRLVWLLNDPPRDELMMIYVEDLARHGLDLETLERDEARWEALREELIERAAASFEIVSGRVGGQSAVRNTSKVPENAGRGAASSPASSSTQTFTR